MAQINQGYIGESAIPLQNNQVNIIEQPVQRGYIQVQPGINTNPQQQGIMYGNPQQQGMMYGNPQQQGMMYGNPQQQEMMYGNPQQQGMMYGNPQQQGMLYGNPQIRPDIWMDRPMGSGCPPGLEYLTKIDQLLVKQRIDLLEVITGYEVKNKYDVKNTLGQTVYKAEEDSECCNRYCFGPNRPFTIHITDNLNTEVITIRREYKCRVFGHCLSCSECSQDEVKVESPPGVTVGYVKQCYEGCNIRYSILDERRNVVLRIHGPSYCKCHCPGDDIPLYLMSANGDIEVGKISKQWSNLIQEYFTDADNFGIQFPIDLDVRIKTVILGAVFLIDFMYFEKGNSRRHRRHRRR